MKLLFLFLFVCGTTLFSDEFTEWNSVKLQLENAGQKIIQLQQEEELLLKTARNMEQTAQVLLHGGKQISSVLKKGTVIYSFPLHSLKGFSRKNRVDVSDGCTVMESDGQNSVIATRWLPIPAGRSVCITVKAKGESVAGLHKRRLDGLRLGAMYSRDGKTRWENAVPCLGTFDWSEMKLQFDLPAGIESVLVVFGLPKETAGKAWFKDLQVTVF